MTSALFSAFCALLLSLFILICGAKLWFRLRKSKFKKNSGKISVGFFHPYCNAGGGGERVLWASIRAVQNRYDDVDCVVYTGDIDVSKEDMLENVKSRFNIMLERDIQIIYLNIRGSVEAKYYPFFTLLCQSVGSIVLGFEALINFVPDIYIDTMGYAFTLPVFKFFGSCRVGAYVHYPTISTDMLDAVSSRKLAVNNRKFISNNSFLSLLKLFYYQNFAFVYGLVGGQAEIIMVNSTWTKGHIDQLWKREHRTFIVYPPCDVSEFTSIVRKENAKITESTRILSIAQFRPEKDHKLQILSFHELLRRMEKPSNLKLILIGSCRDRYDEKRVQDLKELCSDLDIDQNVEFKVNLTFKEIISEMELADIALHTMWNEHFGIGIVECMSAGLIMVAHDSGGPKLDIVVEHNGNKTGFLADDVSSFADALENIIAMTPEEVTSMRNSARESVTRFSEDKFDIGFLLAIKPLFE